TQALIFTASELRTPVRARERISKFAIHGATIAFYLSFHLIREIVDQLLNGGIYQTSTPVAVVYRTTWEDEKIIIGTLDNIAEKVKEAKITKTALIIVGNVINPSSYEFSKVYDPQFTHGYRKSNTESSE